MNYIETETIKILFWNKHKYLEDFQKTAHKEIIFIKNLNHKNRLSVKHS